MTKAILLKNASWQTAHQILANALGLLFNIILARKISQFEFGAYSYIFSLLAIVGLFLELGVPVYFMRKWATDTQNVADDFAALFGTRILIAIPTSLLLLVYVFFVDRFVSLEFLLAYVYILLEIFTQPVRLYFYSQNRFNKTFIIESSERIVSLGGGILLLQLGFPLRIVLAGFIVGRLVSLFWCIWLTRKIQTFKINLKKSWWLVKISLPLFLVSVFSTLYFRIDMLVIRYLLGVEMVGYYSAAYRLLDASALLPSIITTASLPTIIALFSQHEKVKLHKLLNVIVQTLTIVSIHIGVCGVLYAKPVIELIYGEKFTPSIPVLQVLGLNALFLFLTYPLSHLLVANHQEKFYIRILAILFMTNIALNVILIPMIGVLGAAFATLLTEAISVVLLLRRSQIPLEVTPIIKIGIACFVSAGLVAIIPTAWYINVILQSMLYASIILGLKVIDIQEFLPALSRKKYD